MIGGKLRFRPYFPPLATGFPFPFIRNSQCAHER
jgi:hypothetical protein